MTVITLRRMGAYLRAHGVDAWAAYVEALPPEGHEARAFERSQAEIGHPDPFRRGPTAGGSCARNSPPSGRASCR